MIYDIAIIGGGPGGYVAAIRSAQLGAKVLLAEGQKLGGVCLNSGCIPTKTLLKSAEKWDDLKHCADFGLKAENIGFDFAAVMARKEQVVAQLQAGVVQLIKSNNIDVVYGTACLTGKNSLRVEAPDGNSIFEAKNIIIASGSLPQSLPVTGGDLPGVVNSDDMLAMTKLPASLAVIGAGAVGIEFATICRSFGCEVTVLEMMPGILPNIDGDIVKRMGLVLRKAGIKMLTGTKVAAIRQESGGLAVLARNDKGEQEIMAEKVLVASGRRPNVAGLGLESAGVAFSAKGITVDEKLRTNIDNIYAIGDVTGSYMWAHAASAEGVVAVENALGAGRAMDYRAVPGCIYTKPEIASVGLTEEHAQAAKLEVKVSRFNFAVNGKAVTMGEPDGLVKVVAAASDGKVLGLHIMGAHASDLIMEGVIAINNGLKASDIAGSIHPHPSLAEAVMESAHGIDGEIIHQVRLRR